MSPFPWHPSLIQTFRSTYLPSAVNTQLFTALSWVMSSASLALILIASYGFQVYRSSPELSPDAQTHSLNFPLESSTWIFCTHLKFKSFNSSRKSSVPPFLIPVLKKDISSTFHRSQKSEYYYWFRLQKAISKHPSNTAHSIRILNPFPPLTLYHFCLRIWYFLLHY